MDAHARGTDVTARGPHGSDIIAALKASGIEYVPAVSDIVTGSGLLGPIARDNDFKPIRVCKEDECTGIACPTDPARANPPT